MNSAEFQILLQSIRLDDPGKAVNETRDIINKTTINWDEVYQRADLHSVRPQLAKLINRLPSPIVPENFRNNIKNAYRMNLYRQLRNVVEFLKVRDMLEAEGIVVVPYKGFWLANELYGNLADRESVDIDLFIHLSDLDKIITLMPQLDYRTETSSSQSFINKIKKESAEFNFDKFEGKERVSHIEFHWKIGPSLHRMDISLNDLLSQIIPGKLQNLVFPVFTNSTNLLLAIMHHGGKDQLVQLKQVLDISMILEKCDDIDWQWVLREAKKFDVERLVYIGVKLASVLTGVEIPQIIKDQVEAEKIGRVVEERILAMDEEPSKWYTRRFYFKKLLFHLRSRTGFGLRIRMIMGSCRSAIIGFLAPKLLIKMYLKKRYNIDREADR